MGAKVTRIEKKYKDKNSGELKTLVIDYSKVKDRLKEFWEANPAGKISTTPTVTADGRMMFKAEITTNKAEPANSKEADGHALGATSGEKDFEKLETIAVGRALALLGYSSDGEIASSEEMEAFKEFQIAEQEEFMMNSTTEITNTKTLEELKTVWLTIYKNCKTTEAKNALTAIKDSQKSRLTNNPNENA